MPTVRSSGNRNLSAVFHTASSIAADQAASSRPAGFETRPAICRNAAVCPPARPSSWSDQMARRLSGRKRVENGGAGR
jgi:hypothetical protein